jgi:nicotinamide-nucleotide amidase
MKTAYLIIIGDEILNGLTQDANSHFIAHQLNEAGLDVGRIKVISDTEDQILDAFREAYDQADVIICTGGLGPTKDDITKSSLAKFYNCEVVLNTTAKEYLDEYLQQRQINRPSLNESQAYLPEKAIPLRNEKGTAPGMRFDNGEQVAFSLPGVPAEVRHFTTHTIVPYLKHHLQLPATLHKHFHTVGIREAILAEAVEDIAQELPASIGLAYLPALGTVKLRLTGRGLSKEQFQHAIQPFAETLHQRIGTYIYGYDGASLEAMIGKILQERQATVATAESCTGGYLGHLLTSVPGSSAYFAGGVLTYTNALKQQELGVSPETLEQHGAVSEQTVHEMVAGSLRKLHTTYAIAISGVAGPEGGTAAKPVGTVCIGVGDRSQIHTHRFQFFKDRQKNTHMAAIMGMDMLRRYVLWGEVRYTR